MTLISEVIFFVSVLKMKMNKNSLIQCFYDSAFTMKCGQPEVHLLKKISFLHNLPNNKQTLSDIKYLDG